MVSSAKKFYKKHPYTSVFLTSLILLAIASTLAYVLVIHAFTAAIAVPTAIAAIVAIVVPIVIANIITFGKYLAEIISAKIQDNKFIKEPIPKESQPLKKYINEKLDDMNNIPNDKIRNAKNHLTTNRMIDLIINERVPLKAILQLIKHNQPGIENILIAINTGPDFLITNPLYLKKFFEWDAFDIEKNNGGEGFFSLYNFSFCLHVFQEVPKKYQDSEQLYKMLEKTVENKGTSYDPSNQLYHLIRSSTLRVLSEKTKVLKPEAARKPMQKIFSAQNIMYRFTHGHFEVSDCFNLYASNREFTLKLLFVLEKLQYGQLGKHDLSKIINLAQNLHFDNANKMIKTYMDKYDLNDEVEEKLDNFNQQVFLHTKHLTKENNLHVGILDRRFSNSFPDLDDAKKMPLSLEQRSSSSSDLGVKSRTKKRDKAKEFFKDVWKKSPLAKLRDRKANKKASQREDDDVFATGGFHSAFGNSKQQKDPSSSLLGQNPALAQKAKMKSQLSQGQRAHQ